MHIIRDYLNERVLLYDTTEEQMETPVTACAAQRSIVGLDL